MMKYRKYKKQRAGRRGRLASANRTGRIPLQMLVQFAALVVWGNLRCRRRIEDFCTKNDLGEVQMKFLDVVALLVTMPYERRMEYYEKMADNEFEGNTVLLANEIAYMLHL